MIISEIRADHTAAGAEDRVPTEVDLGARRGSGSRPTEARAEHPRDCYHFWAEDGGQARGSDNNPALSGRPWVAPTGGL